MKRIFQIAAFIVSLIIVGSLCGCCGLVKSCLQQVLILTQPASQTAPAGFDVTFSVKALGGPPFTTNGLTYQWQFNPVQLVATNIDANFTNLPGATAAILTITNIQAGTNVGFYRVIVSGSTNVTSDPAELQVITFASPVTVHGTPIASVGNKGTCPGNFAGFVNYTNSGYGYIVINSGVAAKGTDSGSQSGVSRVQMLGWYDQNCANAGTSAICNPPKSTYYLFTTYFPSTVPTGDYTLVLDNLH
jgi:hypothetical protein